MEKTVIYCDICGEGGAYAFSFVVGREMDLAGDLGNVYERVDLCPKCCAEQLKRFIAYLSLQERCRFSNKVRNEKRLYLDYLARTERFPDLAVEESGDVVEAARQEAQETRLSTAEQAGAFGAALVNPPSPVKTAVESLRKAHNHPTK